MTKLSRTSLAAVVKLSQQPRFELFRDVKTVSWLVQNIQPYQLLTWQLLTKLNLTPTKNDTKQPKSHAEKTSNICSN